jgi:AcrR family transcriptional regulator
VAKATTTKPRRSARDRLLEAADRPFYDEDIHTVGIDRILAESGVAKGSLYYSFGGKDDLVRAYLLGRHANWAARIGQQLTSAPRARLKTLAVFDALGDLFARPDFRKCAFINAAAEATSGSAQALATKDYRMWLHELFRGLLYVPPRPCRAREF